MSERQAIAELLAPMSRLEALGLSSTTTNNFYWYRSGTNSVVSQALCDALATERVWVLVRR